MPSKNDLKSFHSFLKSLAREVGQILLKEQDFKGKKFLVTAGPTREALDPVRFITNRSSGKMGYAVAQVAARRSAEVHLVSGPVSLPAPFGVNLHRVTSAFEMQDVITQLAPQMDAIVMAAAVSDYRPSQALPQKLKKSRGEWNITLVNNPDILAKLGQSKHARKPQVLVGFAAETENLVENATTKLKEKNLDLIVANDLNRAGSGFGCDTNLVRIIDRSGNSTELPSLLKEEVAERVWDRIEHLMGKNPTPVRPAPD